MHYLEGPQNILLSEGLISMLLHRNITRPASLIFLSFRQSVARQTQRCLRNGPPAIKAIRKSISTLSVYLLRVDGSENAPPEHASDRARTDGFPKCAHEPVKVESLKSPLPKGDRGSRKHGEIHWPRIIVNFGQRDEEFEGARGRHPLTRS